MSQKWELLLLLLGHDRLFLTPWTAALQASLSFTISWNLLKVMSIQSRMPSNHLILCCPLLLLPSVFPNIRIFSNESTLHIRWPKYWSFSFSISHSNEYSGLISFRIDWFDLLAVQGTLRNVIGQKLYVALVSELRDWQLSGKSNSWSPMNSTTAPMSAWHLGR